MAWRIEQAVIRGEIDNTVEGLTNGRIWLAGCDVPLELSLDGDCWRDLAGTRLHFENPAPQPGPETAGLAVDQSGVIGDMTASRKTKLPWVGDQPLPTLRRGQQDVSCEWRNTLYLEWFSEFNGRVVIEASTFTLRISAHEWELDEDAEAAQKLANLNAMRDFMTLVIQRRDDDAPGAESVAELDEFAWEERLKENDRLTDAYQEVLEKYIDDPDSERKEAFVMGWDGLLDALAERDEAAGHGDEDDDDEDADPHLGNGLEEDFDDELAKFSEADGSPFDDSDAHPLQASAQALACQAMDLVENTDGPGSPSYLLITNLLQVSGKLASVLNDYGSSYQPENGFVLAVLKRCLNWLNEALGACQILHETANDPAKRAAFKKLQAAAFQVRDQIVGLRRNFKKT
ncbi:MAG: hypothetical protein DVB26_06490 [Verrucomicrobia bacterium]|nr:MAG: hypothetical protein DVB26_06490 [Verrucomicrobiota bacterium]